MITILEKSTMSITVKQLVKLFMEHTARLLATEDRAPDTVKFYRSRFKWLLVYFPNRKWKTIRSIEVLEFLEFAGKGRAGTTQRHNVTAINTLQKFALKHGVAKKRIFRDLEKPPMGHREFIPTEEQIDQLLSGASVQFRIIHGMLLQSGARPGEMCGLQIEDVRWSEGVISLAKHRH